MRRLLVSVLGVVLVACGSGTAVVQVDDPQALLAAAPDTVRELGSARFTMRMDMTSEDLEGTVTVQGRGQMQFDPARFAVLGTMSGQGDTFTYEMRLLDGTFYMRMPQAAAMLPQGVSWYSLDPTALEEQGMDVSSMLEANQNQDPTATLEHLRGASDDVRVIGQEVVREVPTTHYRATVDVQRALESMPPELREAGGGQLSQMPEEYEMDIWIDADGLPRRMAFQMTLTPEASSPLTQSMTMEMFDYGEPVDISPPAAEITRSLFELMHAT